MVSPDSLALSSALPRPPRGGSTRVRVGRFELVLEAVRGGYLLLWLDGREARRYALGLAEIEELTLELLAPAWPCRVVVRETIVLTPGARMRGYVQVPLVPSVWGRREHGERVPLLELANGDLGAEWDERLGTTFRVTSPWHVRFPMPAGEPRAIVPLSLINQSDAVLTPADLPVPLVAQDLWVTRSSIVARPRRLVWDGQGWQAAPRCRAEVER